MDHPARVDKDDVDQHTVRGGRFESARRALPVVGLCTAVVLLVALVYYVVDVLLLAFAGALLAIALRAPAEWVAARTRLPVQWAVGLVAVGIVGVFVLAGWAFGSGVSDQLATLWHRLPDLIARVRSRFSGFSSLIGQIDPQSLVGPAKAAVSHGLVSTFGFVTDIVIVLFSATFFALQPRSYLNAVLSLVPLPQRRRAAQVLVASGETLRSWLLGQLFLMVVMGVVIALGLSLLGVPLALALGFLGGLLEFIPYLGPLTAAAAGLLVALGESPQLALYALIFYLLIDTIEGNVLQPLVQSHTVALLPAMILFSQVMLGILLGLGGVVLATPLAAVALVMLRMLYIEDVLNADPDALH